MGERVIDPDCRDDKHRNCPGGICQCECHSPLTLEFKVAMDGGPWFLADVLAGGAVESLVGQSLPVRVALDGDGDHVADSVIVAARADGGPWATFTVEVRAADDAESLRATLRSRGVGRTADGAYSLPPSVETQR